MLLSLFLKVIGTLMICISLYGIHYINNRNEKEIERLHGLLLESDKERLYLRQELNKGIK